MKVLPVKNDDEALLNYSKEVYQMLDDANIRVELDDRSEKLGYRMREGQLQKVPYLLVLGNNEKEEKTVTYRLHGQKETTTVPAEEFVQLVKDMIASKKFV